MHYVVSVAVLVALLFVSTLLWARPYSSGAESAEVLHRTLRARLWAAGVSWAMFSVLVLGSLFALFSAGGTEWERLVAAYTSPKIVAGLVVCTVAALYPAYLCVRSWRSSGASLHERLHMAVHLSMVYALVAVVLSLRGVTF
ncbi:MAG: hypothetical protein JXA58_04470 [Dehalococcoidia bacterium]|nr:hypothetical protein [Dehalococcoidia bacterium]